MFKKLFSRAAALPPLAPERPLWVIGDIHGRFDLIKRLLQHIDEMAVAKAQIITVGDYIDRGEQNRQAIELIYARDRGDENFTALYGNHEELMLNFFDEPAISANRWLRNGGLQTMASYKIGGLSERPDAKTAEEAAKKIQESLSEGMEDWLRNLPRSYSSGNVHVVHAAADPDVPMSDQDDHTLTWGHEDFDNKPRQDGQWIVYGHKIVETAGKDKLGRIAVDTGAYYSGKLTAALIMPDGDLTLHQA